MLNVLKKDGWFEHHQRGSHLALRHPYKQGQVTIPMHAGKDIHPTTLKYILKQAGITEDDFIRLLKRR
jgi:predicted RNA binding protein YcfA (HicA-like mRNA interferase family)